jgi:glycosyltransferase involved in cell wall biosynthesis
VKYVALVQSPEHVCCRYRLVPFRDCFPGGLELVALPRGVVARLLLFRRLRGAAVIVQRQLLPGWQLALLRRAAARLVFDFDDAIYLRDSYSPKGLRHPRNERRFAAMVKASDVVVAGNRFLTEAAPGARVIPTCVEVAKYRPANGDGRTLVWVGSSSTLQGLEREVALFDRIAERVPGVRLRVVCDRFPKLGRMPVEERPWSEASEADEIATAGVGVGLVPDDAWSRGKCGLKVLQYMAAGLPVVANPCGVQADMVTHGENGFLATTEGEWAEAVARLVGDEALRRRMGAAGRAIVEARYDVAVGMRGWDEVVSRLARRVVA